MDLAKTVTEGDRRRSLEVIRDRLAVELEALTNEHSEGCTCECAPAESDGRVVVQVAKELRAVIAELDALPRGKGVSGVDEVARKRAERRKAAAAKART